MVADSLDTRIVSDLINTRTLSLLDMTKSKTGSCQRISGDWLDINILSNWGTSDVMDFGYTPARDYRYLVFWIHPYQSPLYVLDFLFTPTR